MISSCVMSTGASFFNTILLSAAVSSIPKIFRNICKPGPTFQDFSSMTEVKFEEELELEF